MTPGDDTLKLQFWEAMAETGVIPDKRREVEALAAFYKERYMTPEESKDEALQSDIDFERWQAIYEDDGRYDDDPNPYHGTYSEE